MSYTIAVAGKGGTGKTTLCSLMIRYLVSHGRSPVLAIDADANSNLHEALGVEKGESVGHLREKAIDEVKALSVGVTKEQYIEQRIHQTLVEGTGYDLISMGRPEGPGCYCYANHLIRKYSDKISQSYKYVVMDNEAGLEHLSRRTTQGVEAMVIVTDESMRGLRTVQRILDIIEELELAIDQKFLLVNRTLNGLPDAFTSMIEKMKVQFLGAIPSDDKIVQFDLEGKPLVALPEDSVAVQKVAAVMEQLVGD